MKYLITPILLSSILMLISCSEDTTAGEELSSLAITLQMPSKQEVETRVGLSPIERSKDLYAIWSSNDKVQAILRRGNEMFDLGRAKVTNISNDHRTATINFDRRATPNYNPPYTIYLFTGNTHPASADAIGGGNWSAYCTYDIIRESLESFNAPMFSQIVVNGKDVPVAHFTHFGTYELLHLKNDTNMPITVVHQGFNCEKPWYQASTTVWFNDDYDHTNLSGEWEGDVDSPELTIMPHADRTIVSWYIPSGFKINEAQLIATINGNAGITSTNTFSSNAKIQRGHAYHMYATWDGKELKFGKGDITPSTIKVEPEKIDFGEIKVGSSKTEYFTVSNVGKSKLTFSVSEEHGTFDIPESGKEFTLEAGESKKFSVKFSLSEENTGALSAVRIFSDAENGTQYLQLSGRTGSSSSNDPVAYTSCPDSNHPHLIDLGLPSGTLWACCNVGATKPEEYGGYYAWGETEEKSEYYARTYKHCDGTEETCHDMGESICGTEYDVAHVKWGGKWQMPSREQIEELWRECKTYGVKWLNGIKGLDLGFKNGGRLFLPAAGEKYEAVTEGQNGYGDYFSGTQYLERTHAYGFYFFYEGWTYGKWVEKRWNGHSVRPVYQIK